MNRFQVFVVVSVAAIVGIVILSRSVVSAQAPTATDLVIGQAYEVADFRTCEASDGSLRKDWHFGGASRSLRAQLTPERDGRGRPIFRVVTGDLSLPAGHMRLRKVAEADPSLEGFVYGSYSWSGLHVEYNGHVKPQRVVGSCGPAR